MSQTITKSCETCSVEITADQIISRQAGMVLGKLLCPGCISKLREGQSAQQQALPAGRKPAAPGLAAKLAERMTTQAPALHGEESEEEKLALANENAEITKHKIRSFAEGSTLGGVHHDSELKRPLAAPDMPPTRCRTFHSKLTPAALAHCDDQINEWTDHHPDVYIKKIATTVGVFEGKKSEPHLIITIFY